MYKNYKEIKSKKTVWSTIKMNQAGIIIVFLFIGFILREHVTDKLSFLYMIFTVGCGIYLAMPSGMNKERENYHSILIFIKNNKNTYKPICEGDEENEEEKRISIHKKINTDRII